MPGGAQILHTETLLDINGNEIQFVFAAYNN